jgi:hypothetical protein
MLQNKDTFRKIFITLGIIFLCMIAFAPIDYTKPDNVIINRSIQFIVTFFMNLILSSSIDSITFWTLVKSCPEYWALALQTIAITTLIFEAQALQFPKHDSLYEWMIFAHVMYGVQLGFCGSVMFSFDSMPFAGRTNKLFTIIYILFLLLYLRIFMYSDDLYSGIICIPGYLDCVNRYTYLKGFTDTMILLVLKGLGYQLLYPGSLLLISARVESMVPTKATSAITYIMNNANLLGSYVALKSKRFSISSRRMKNINVNIVPLTTKKDGDEKEGEKDLVEIDSNV